MSNRTISMTDRLYDYYLKASLREPEILRRLRMETARLAEAGMQIAPEQGQFMGFLIELMGARKSIEIGTFTGYSALSVALAMPPGGRVIACDVSEEWTAIGRRFWEEAGVADRIELRLAPAVETLAMLRGAGQSGTFDFAFVDADKTNYDAYYEACLDLVREGGLVAFDNVLWDGRVADPAANDASTVAIRELNAKLKNDSRISLTVVPIGDGLTLARKRG